MSIHLYYADGYPATYEKCLEVIPAKLYQQELIYTPDTKEHSNHSFGVLSLFNLKEQSGLGAAFISIETGVSTQELTDYIIYLCENVKRDKIKYSIFTSSSKVFRILESCVLKRLLKTDELFIYYKEQRYTFLNDGCLFDGENEILKLPDGFFGFDKEQLAKSHYRF